MESPHEGQRYTKQDGHAVRVDRVKDGHVYFVSWRPGQKHGSARRMETELFVSAIESHALELEATMSTKEIAMDALEICTNMVLVTQRSNGSSNRTINRRSTYGSIAHAETGCCGWPSG